MAAGSFTTGLRGGAATSLDGTRIAFLRTGAGPRLIFLPGGLGAGWNYRAVAEELSDRYESILVDRRGLGCSDFGTEPYMLEREAEDVLAVIETVGPIAGVVGHSHGAVVALLAAHVDKGGSIPAMVLCEPAMGPVGPIQVDMTAAVRPSVLAGAYEEAITSYFDKVVELTPEAATGVAALKTSPQWPNLVALAPMLLRGDAIASVTADEFSTVPIPVLLVHGSETIRPHKVAVEELHGSLPRSTVAVLQGEGHTAHATAPAVLAATIVNFLESDLSLGA
jgi:pimeloyl-ACP methyl ester carboxylesterase